MTLPELARAETAPAAPGRMVVLANGRARNVDRAAMSLVASALRLDDAAIREVGHHGTARALAADAVRGGARCIVVAGGDGTLHEVIQVVARTPTALGILPLGTSNDLAQRIGIPGRLDRALGVLRTGCATSVDLLRIGRSRIATVGGFGLPAHVARECNDLRAQPGVGRLARRLGGAIYSAGAAVRIARRGAQAATYSIGSCETLVSTLRASAILVGLTERFGGGLSLTPDGPPAVGTFATLIVTADSRPALLRTLLALRAGMRVSRWTIRYAGLERLEVRTRSLVGAFGDGEWLGLRHRAVVAIEPAALRVVAPHATHTAVRSASSRREAL